MRKLIARVFFHSIDGFLPDQGTPYWDYCFSVPTDPIEDELSMDLYRGADIHVMGSVSYQSMFQALTSDPDHRVAKILTPAKKVVFSHSLDSVDWVNTTIASGDMTDEVESLRRGGDGYVVVWGGVRLWRSLLNLNLLDELHIDMFPCIAGEGTKLFDGDPKQYELHLVTSTAWSNGIVGLRYRKVDENQSR